MSIEDAKAYWQKLDSDPDFRKQIESIQGAEARIEYVKSCGLNFCEEESKEAYLEEGRELTDEELGLISGGCMPWEQGCYP